MEPEGINLESAAALRQRAESKVQENDLASADFGTMPADEAAALLHELRVHQVELEMQNDNLRMAQLELDAAKTRYFDLFNLTPVGYCILSFDGTILEANLTLANLLGVSRTELVEQRITRFIHTEDQDHFYLSHKHYTESGEPYDGELRMLRQDGSSFWAHLIVTANHGVLNVEQRGSEVPTLYHMAVNDITDRKQAEGERARMEAQLQHVEKLQTLGVLAGGVAHDFNNILTAIVGHANLGAMAAEPGSRMFRSFESIEKSAMKAAVLTSQLLAYAGKGKYLLMTVDLDIIVKEVIQLIRDAQPRNTPLRCDLVGRLPFISGDPSQISQILTNLVTNAREAIEDGSEGTITIRTRAERLETADIESGTWILPLAPGYYTTLEVEDTGVGMAPEILALAFDPFFSTKFTGRGLGLSAVVGILGSHGGSITARSTLGRGSSFKIYLPAMQGDRPLPRHEDTPSWRGDGRLLLVDDEEAVRVSARLMAERLGFSVIEAAQGEEAVALFRVQHENLSLVLLDVSMPHMSGWEVFREMRKIDRHVPVILSSGHDMQAHDMGVEGLAGFLKKPYRFAELQNLLQKALALRCTP